MKLKRIGARRLWQSAVLAVLMTGAALAFTGEKLLPQAKVTLPQAGKVALNAYPGKVVSDELEQESGGSGLRYSFVMPTKVAVRDPDGNGIPLETVWRVMDRLDRANEETVDVTPSRPAQIEELHEDS